MKKVFMIACFISLFTITPATFAMNSEFQKPDDALEEDVYATPAQEDTGEIIESDPAAPPPAEILPPLVTPDEEPAAQTETPAAQPEQENANAATTSNDNVTITPVQPEAIEQLEQTEEAPEADVTEPVEAIAEETVETDAITTTTAVDGDEKEIVIEQSNNFWLFVIAGGTVLFIIVLLLFQRLRNNNPYDR